jgi:tRNA uridine 5-carboxymethylaminomethyl modification enzyme
MLTSRAEFRLLLRHDNADLRLTDYGYETGLITKERYDAFTKKRQDIQIEIAYLNDTTITPTKEISEYFTDKGFSVPKGKTTLAEILKRPEITYEDIENISGVVKEISDEVKEQVEINIKYAGYIDKSLKEAERLKKENNIKIPIDIDYNKVNNLALEARAKLSQIRPLTISQASRISGVNPADIQMLLMYLKKL